MQDATVQENTDTPEEETLLSCPVKGLQQHPGPVLTRSFRAHRPQQTHFLKMPNPQETLSPESPFPRGPGRRAGLLKGLVDLLFGVVHAVPSAQLGHGVVESHLRF